MNKSVNTAHRSKDQLREKWTFSTQLTLNRANSRTSTCEDSALPQVMMSSHYLVSQTLVMKWTNRIDLDFKNNLGMS